MSCSTRRLCEWCEASISPAKRVDARFCSTRCRQAMHRFGAGLRSAVVFGSAMRFGFADPPYPGKAGYYVGHPDYAGEVDHEALFEVLCDGFPDGWALSTSAEALPSLLRLPSCPTSVRVAAWVRGERPNPRAVWPLSSWEPVIVYGGRPYPSAGDRRRVDSLVHVARPRLTDPRRVIGAKPAAFAWWMFDLLGALPHDELVDVFPGSGGVGRAWELYRSPGERVAPAGQTRPRAERDASSLAMGPHDASPLDRATRRADPADASSVDGRRIGKS